MALNQIALARRMFLERVKSTILHQDNSGCVNIADKDSHASREIGLKLVDLVGGAHCTTKRSGQTAGALFANEIKFFLEECFKSLHHLHPARWEFATEKEIYHFSQYEHLSQLENIMKVYDDLRSIVGTDYLVKPDVVILRQPLSDEEIGFNKEEPIPPIACLTPIRASNILDNNRLPILQGIVSCKWTIRSDRSQNTRTEALNLVRNRKGRTPSITAATAEPLPSRLASLCLGTGDIDCVYHFALHELVKATEMVLATSTKKANKNSLLEQLEALWVMINSKRLRDISDLPLDLIT